MLIYLIGYHICVVLFRKPCYKLKLLKLKYLAAWIGRIAQYKRLGPVLKRLLKPLGIKIIFRRVKGHVYRFSAGEYSVRAIVFIKRRKYCNLISRIRYGHHGGHHGLGSSAGNNYLLLRIYIHAHERRLLFRNGLP